MDRSEGPDNTLKLAKVTRMASPDDYFAISSAGAHVRIPKELFDALQEFLETKRAAGSITLQFKNGEITCVEALAKKTYRYP